MTVIDPCVLCAPLWRGRSRPDMTRRSPYFIPPLISRKLFELGFISLHSRHTMGIAVDVGIVRIRDYDIGPSTPSGRCDGPFEQRVNESSLDFGTAYDCFSDLSATASPNISATPGQIAKDFVAPSKPRVSAIIHGSGWHYDFTGSSVPTQAYDFPVR
jgi:D-alanyl-D-alanine dipeptidase